MELEIKTDVDREHSLDPSYIIRYQVFEKGTFLGDGVVQYHRLAEHNDYHIPAAIKRPDGSALDPGIIKRIKTEIDRAAREAFQTAE